MKWERNQDGAEWKSNDRFGFTPFSYFRSRTLEKGSRQLNHFKLPAIAIVGETPMCCLPTMAEIIGFWSLLERHGARNKPQGWCPLSTPFAEQVSGVGDECMSDGKTCFSLLQGQIVPHARGKPFPVTPCSNRFCQLYQFRWRTFDWSLRLWCRTNGRTLLESHAGCLDSRNDRLLRKCYCF